METGQPPEGHIALQAYDFKHMSLDLYIVRTNLNPRTIMPEPRLHQQRDGELSPHVWACQDCTFRYLLNQKPTCPDTCANLGMKVCFS